MHDLRRVFAWAARIVFLVAIAFAVPAEAKPAVTGAKLGVEPNLTRVELALSESAEYRIFALAEPNRIVIDMSEVAWKVKEGKKLQGRGLVAALRYGLFKAGTSRIVLDLTGPAAVTDARILPADGKQPARLALDLRPTDSAAFKAAAQTILFASAGAAAPGGPATPANQNRPQTTLLRFWDTATGRQLGQARAAGRTGASDGSPELKTVWSADGKSVVSANDLGVVAFPSGKVIAPPNPLATTVQAADRQGTLVTVQDRSDQRSLSFWNVRTLKQIGTPVATPDGKTPIAALSPDGRLLATTDMQGKIDLWDVQGQRRLGLPLTGHTSASVDATIESLAFSPDGTGLYSVSGDDGKLVTHTVAPRLLKDGLCARVGALSKREWAQYVQDIPYEKTC